MRMSFSPGDKVLVRRCLMHLAPDSRCVVCKKVGKILVVESLCHNHEYVRCNGLAPLAFGEIVFSKRELIKVCEQEIKC